MQLAGVRSEVTMIRWLLGTLSATVYLGRENMITTWFTFLLFYVSHAAAAKSLQSCLTVPPHRPTIDPTIAYQTPPSLGFSRQNFYTFQLCVALGFCFVLFSGTTERASIFWSQNCPIQLSGFPGMLLLCIGVINKYLGNV